MDRNETRLATDEGIEELRATSELLKDYGFEIGHHVRQFTPPIWLRLWWLRLFYRLGRCVRIGGCKYRLTSLKPLTIRNIVEVDECGRLHLADETDVGDNWYFTARWLIRGLAPDDPYGDIRCYLQHGRNGRFEIGLLQRAAPIASSGLLISAMPESEL